MARGTPRAMPARLDLPAALRALIDAGISIARRSPTTQVVLARAAGVVGDADLPPRLRAELDDAVAEACRPVDAKRIEKVLRDAWGKPPAKVLDGFDREPLAVRAGAQVHAGELDGDAVAIKVLRPGLAAAVRSDLALLDALRIPLAQAFPALDVGGVLQEVREGAQDELDLEHEAAQQRLVGRALRGVEDVTVPRVHGDLCAEDVLVSERLAGPTLHDGAVPADPERVARALVRAHLQAVRRAGVALTDPRPGHVVLLGDGGVGLLGAGVGREVSAARLDLALEALAALRDRDGADALADVAERAGMCDAETARAAHPLLREVIGEALDDPVRLDQGLLDEIADRALRRVGPLYALAVRCTPEPADISALRGAGQLGAVLARLEASQDWPQLVLDEAR